MAKRKRSRARRLVLDIGSSAVRLCELTQTKAGYQLTKYYQREFPIDPAMEEETQREVRRDTVKAVLKDSKVRYKKTVMGVPGQSVFTRPRALPPVPEYKLSQIVRYEIQQLIPFPLENVAWGYQVLNVTEAGGFDVLMAAIKVDVVEKRLEILRDVKKQIDIVDVCPLAAYNWFKYTGEFGDQGETVALLDLGAATTDIVIEREGQFRFTRSLNIGGNDITKAIAESFGMDYLKAEQLKRERGFAPTGDPNRDGKGGEVIGRVLSRLVGEINRSFGYFRAQPGGGPVSRVVVTGGGACLRNIIPFLQRQLGVEVRIAQPLAGLAIAPSAQEVNDRPEQAAVALGLALRCCESVPLEINLIPPRILEAARRREQLFYWALSIATMLLIMASIIPERAQQNQEIRKQIELAKDILRMYDGRMVQQPGDPSTWKSNYEDDLKRYEQQVEQQIEKTRLLDNAFVDRIVWIEYLNALNDARPPGKLVVFSLVESTTIAPKPAEDATRRDRDGSRMNFGGIGGGGADSSAYWTSTGFPGLGPGGGGGSGNTPSLGGGLNLGGGRDSAPRGRGGRGNVQAAAAIPPPPAPNGFRVRGYVSDEATLEQFLNNLKDSEAFVEGGVYFNDKWTEPVQENVLDNAPVLAFPGSDRGGQSRRGQDEERGGMNFSGLMQGGLGQGGNLVQPAPTEDMRDPTENKLLSFVLDVQFSGQAVLSAPTPGAAPAGDPGVLGGRGLPGLGQAGGGRSLLGGGSPGSGD